MTKFFFIINIFFSINFNGFSQSISSLCRPDIKNFNKNEYGGYNQNWCIAQDHVTKFLYFANSKGLLEYDGSNWQVYELPQKQKVRSLYIGKTGIIYTGGLNEFGYWLPRKNGKLTYHTLKNIIPDKSFQSEEIWNIIPVKSGILFQSFAFLYLYENNKISKIQSPGNVLFMHEAKGKFYIEVIDKGLYELNNNQLVKVLGSEFLSKESINTILEYDSNNILIGTSKNIYLFNGKTFKDFNKVTNVFFQQNQLNKGYKINDSTFAFGTILNGIVITDRNGKIIYHFSQKNGLQNNTVLSLTKDEEGNLWAGLDKGIDIILLSSPVRYYNDFEGNLGTVYDIKKHKGKLYLGTNHGVFYHDLTIEGQEFKLIPKTQGQAWNFEIIDDQLLCGHNNGTFLIDNNKAELISNVTGGWVIKRLKKNPNFLIQGTYTNLVIYKKGENGKWIFSHSINGFSSPTHQIEEDNLGDIWVKNPAKEVVKLKLSTDLKETTNKYTFNEPDLVGSSVNLFKIYDKTMLTSKNGVLIYNQGINKFEKSHIFNSNQIKKVFPILNDGAFILNLDGTLGIIKNQILKPALPIQKFNWVDDNENILDVDNQSFAVCTENGFGLLPKNIINFKKGISGSKPLIRSFTLPDHPLLNKTFRDAASEKIYLNYDENNLDIFFSSTIFSYPLTYSYWLENTSKQWSTFQHINHKEFNNLSPGKYIFHLKSNLSERESTILFEIKPPWYWNALSITIYSLLIISIFIILYILHLKRLHEKQDRTRRRLEKKLKRQEDLSRQKITELKNEQLRQDVNKKSEELANSTMVLIKKNELLQEIKQLVVDLKNDTTGRSFTNLYRQILNLIERNISSEHDWEVFESNFNKVHDEFLMMLVKKFPDLSAGDLKLSAYLRMNLSTKEIAQLLNITNRSVELKRYRLRKKLNLETEESLGEFMIKFN